MSRYISVDWLMDYFADDIDYYGKYVREDIEDNMPTIEIIPCRECRRVREDGGHANCGGYLYCRKWKTIVDEDNYCSWGERSGE